MQELSLQEMGIVPLVNAYILIAHTNKLQGFTPLRTGFLKTLKDSWFEGVTPKAGRAASLPGIPCARENITTWVKLLVMRLAAFVLTLFAASIILFVAIKVVPGSAARSALGVDATPQAIMRFEAQHGLDRPLYVQYTEWFGKALKGDFGKSSRTACRSVRRLLLRLPVTLELALCASSSPTSSQYPWA